MPKEPRYNVTEDEEPPQPAAKQPAAKGPAAKGRKLLKRPNYYIMCLNSSMPAGCSEPGRRAMAPSGRCYDRPLAAMFANTPVGGAAALCE